MNKKIKLALIVVGILLAIGIGKDIIIKNVISLAAGQITGAKVEIRSLSLGVLRQAVRISGFKIHNPQGFPPGVIVDLPKIGVDYDLASILTGKMHLRKVEIELKEMGLIRNKEGKLNVDSLKVAQQEPKKEGKPKKPAKPMTMKIDQLDLNIGRIVLKDYRIGTEPAVEVFEVNLKKSYKNITSAEQMAALILSEPMKHAGIRGAAIYSVALLSGVGIIPVAIISTFMEKDNISRDLSVPIDRLYDVSLAVLSRMGKVNKEDREARTINAVVNSADVVLKLTQISQNSTKVTISARKYLLPKAEVANGVLYQINEELK